MVSLKKFHFDKSARTLTAEFSDFGRDFNMERAYPDACDLGVRVINPDNGNEVMFVIDHEERDNEGELKWYDLIPTPQSVRKVPAAKGLKMTIFND